MPFLVSKTEGTETIEIQRSKLERSIENDFCYEKLLLQIYEQLALGKSAAIENVNRNGSYRFKKVAPICLAPAR
jgi:hypothetical protein